MKPIVNHNFGDDYQHLLTMQDIVHMFGALVLEILFLCSEGYEILQVDECFFNAASSHQSLRCADLKQRTTYRCDAPFPGYSVCLGLLKPKHI